MFTDHAAAARPATGSRILLVEDDPEIRALLVDFLGREGYAVATAAGGAEMDRELSRGVPDLVVLDVMLPGEDGLSICRRLRARGDLPILMLTAKNDDVDRIVGLEVGADDYLGKPFNPRELLARIRAVMRRAGARERTARRRKAFAGLTADLDARSVETGAHERLGLTTAEFDLLVCFLERPNRVLTRDQLLDWTRGRAADPFDRTIDVSVSRLRAKLGPAVGDAGNIITTVRNVGYLFAATVSDLDER